MNILYILILISLMVATGFLIAFLWAVSQGQFEDDYTPAIRILFDDSEINEKEPDSVTKETIVESNKK